MGYYYRNWTLPDGNCFFHAVHDLLVARGDEAPAPDVIRQAAANYTAGIAFGTTYDQLVQELGSFSRPFRAGLDLTTLKDALNSHLKRAGGAPLAMHATPTPKQAAVFIALLGASTLEGLARFKAAADGCELRKATSTLVWADADEGDFGGVPASGIALDAVKHLYNMPNLKIVTSQRRDQHGLATSVLDWTEEHPSDLFLFHSGGHFQALLWNPAARPLPAPRLEPSLAGSCVTAPASLKIGREVLNTLAGSVIFGAVTWNFNHLGKQGTKHLLAALKASGETDELDAKSASSSDTADQDFDMESAGPRRSRRTASHKAELAITQQAQASAVEASADSQAAAQKLARKLRALEDLIQHNSDWIDVIALQEVNQGIDYLAAKTVKHYKEDKPLTGLQGGNLYTCHRGPMFHSVPATGNEQTGQKEYYPLLIPAKRPASRPPLEYRGWTAVFPGRQEVDEGNDASAEHTTLYWTKRAVYRGLNRSKQKKIDQCIQGRFYRPVLVHRLRLGDQWVNVAVVHTTPSGTELNRTEVFYQVEDFFRRVASRGLDRAKAAERPDLWVVTGDYYLFGEASVFALNAIRSHDDIMLSRIARYLDDTRKQYEDLRKVLKPDEGKDIGKSMGTRKRKGSELAPIAPEKQVTIPHALDQAQQKALYNDTKALTSYVNALDAALWAMRGLDAKRANEAIKLIIQLEQRLLDAMPTQEDHNKKQKSTEKASTNVDEDEEVEEDDEEEDALSEDEHEPAPDNEEQADEDAAVTGHKYHARARQASRSAFVRLRNLLGYSFAERVANSFQILQPPAATNVHASADLDKPQDDPSRKGKWGQDQSKDQTAFRIADFFVVDKRWLSHEAGLLVDQIGGGLVWADDEVSSQSERWREISDHFPMGVRLSTAPHDARVERALRPDKLPVREMARLFEDAARQDLGALRRLTDGQDWETANEAARRQMIETLLAEPQDSMRDDGHSGAG